MGKVKVDIKGSCVTREAFNYIDKCKNQYEVSNYIFQKPMKVLFSNPINNSELLKTIQSTLLNNMALEYVVRDVEKSFNKEFFINEDGDKYIIVDFVDERIPLLKCDDSYIEYRTPYAFVADEYPNITKEKAISNEEMGTYLDKLMEKLIATYGKDKIIINRSFAVYESEIDGKRVPLSSIIGRWGNKDVKSSYTFEKISLLNRRLISAYSYLHDNYSDIKTIDLPMEKYYAPDSHYLKTGPYHYDDEFYYDFMDKLDELIEGKYSGDDDVYNSNINQVKKYEAISKIISNEKHAIINPELRYYSGFPECMKSRIEINMPQNFDMEFYEVSDIIDGYLLRVHNTLVSKMLVNKVTGNTTFYFRVNNKFEKLLEIAYSGEFFIDDDKKYGLNIRYLNNNLRVKTILISKGSKNIFKVISYRDEETRVLIYLNNKISFNLTFIDGLFSGITCFEDGNKIREFKFDKFLYHTKLSSDITYGEDKSCTTNTYDITGGLRLIEKDLNEVDKVKEFYNYEKLEKIIDYKNNVMEKVVFYRGKINKQKAYFFEEGIPVRKEVYDDQGNVVQLYSRDEHTPNYVKEELDNEEL